MQTPPREWRFFGDAPATEAAPQDESLELPVDHAAVQSAPQPAGDIDTHLRELVARVRAAPWLLVGAGVAGITVLGAVFLAVVLGASSGNAEAVVIADRPDDRGAVTAAESQGFVTGGAAIVDIEGAVLSPGLRRVAAGARVGDAIAAAGGYSDAVDLAAAATQLNLAEPLTDGDKVRVPSRTDRTSAPLAGQAGDGQPDSGGGAALIDLNHADEAALESLPGIGPATAAKIISARAAKPFASLEDAQSRKVINASVVEQIRGLTTVLP
jgi:competence protein ComEA